MGILDAIKQGDRFGRYTILSRCPEYRFICKCDCGTVKSVPGYCLLRGDSRSCGCLMAQIAYTNGFIHGETANNSVSPEFRAWISMRRRCYAPKDTSYRNYGARGITVCPEWRESFLVFLHDVGRRPSPNHSIERKDNSGNYEPGNVRWATTYEQGRNRRTNVFLVVNGQKKTIVEWAEISGIQEGTIWFRKKRGWPDDACISKTKRTRLLTLLKGSNRG